MILFILAIFVFFIYFIPPKLTKPDLKVYFQISKIGALVSNHHISFLCEILTAKWFCSGLLLTRGELRLLLLIRCWNFKHKLLQRETTDKPGSYLYYFWMSGLSVPLLCHSIDQPGCLKISPRSSTGRAWVRLQVNAESDQRQISLSNLRSAPFSARRLPFPTFISAPWIKQTNSNTKKGCVSGRSHFQMCREIGPLLLRLSHPLGCVLWGSKKRVASSFPYFLVEHLDLLKAQILCSSSSFISEWKWTVVIMGI